MSDKKMVTDLDVAGKKAESAIEISRLKFKIVQLNTDVRKGYEKIGNIVYNSMSSRHQPARLSNTY